jgi:hypothetical protein
MGASRIAVELAISFQMIILKKEGLKIITVCHQRRIQNYYRVSFRSFHKLFLKILLARTNGYRACRKKEVERVGFEEQLCPLSTFCHLDR